MMEWLVILGGIFLVIWLFFSHYPKSQMPILMALGLAMFWVGLSGIYTYRESNSFLGSFNMLALVAWTAGLTLLWLIYSSLPRKHAWVLSIIMYVALLIIIEFVGYNWMGIKLVTDYPGLGGLPLMHMPWWAQTYYLLAGPLYLSMVRGAKP